LEDKEAIMSGEEREELEREAAKIAAQHKYLPYVPDVPLPEPARPQQVVIVKRESLFLSTCWVIQIIACCLAVLVFLGTVFQAAPQVAAGSAAACAIVIIPYVFTRAVEYLAG
jgi:hypothetical protein